MHRHVREMDKLVCSYSELFAPVKISCFTVLEFFEAIEHCSYTWKTFMCSCSGSLRMPLSCFEGSCKQLS